MTCSLMLQCVISWSAVCFSYVSYCALSIMRVLCGRTDPHRVSSIICELALRIKGCSNTRCSPRWTSRLLGVAQQELESSALFLALSKQARLLPHGVLRSGSSTIASRVPPSADLGNHLCDAFVVVSCLCRRAALLAVQNASKILGLSFSSVVRRDRGLQRRATAAITGHVLAAGNPARDWNAHHAPLNIVEAATANERQHCVSEIPQADLIVSLMHIDLETSECPTSVRTHIHHVKV